MNGWFEFLGSHTLYTRRLPIPEEANLMSFAAIEKASPDVVGQIRDFISGMAM